MSYQSRKFLKFFWAINCCSYKTHGFKKKFAFRENIFALRILRTYISLHLFSRNFAKKFAKCDRTLHWTVGRRYFYMGWCFIVKCFSSFHFSHYHEDFNLSWNLLKFEVASRLEKFLSFEFYMFYEIFKYMKSCVLNVL